LSTPRFIVVFAGLLAAAISIHSPTPASAQAKPDPAAMEEAKKHFAEGRKKYDAGDKKGAVEEFKEAYKLSRIALFLYNIGFVYDELKDKPLALHYYTKFLKDAPDNAQTAANRKLASERIPLLEKEIAADEKAAGGTGTGDTGTGGTGTGGTGTGDTGTGDTGDGKPKIIKFTHEIVEEAPPKFPLDITAQIPEDSNWKLTLYYRAAGQDSFKSTKMKQRYHELVGRIPSTAMLGTSVQYYIEVKDANGTTVDSSGRGSSPNIVYIDKEAKPHFYRELEEGGSGSMAGEDEGADLVPDQKPIAGPIEPGSKRGTLWWAKWGTSAGAVLLFAGAVVAYQTASNNANALEVDAANSAGCVTTPPCHQFSNDQKTWEADGKFNETLANVLVISGGAVAVTAGVLWYLDLKRSKGRRLDLERKAPIEEEDAAAPSYFAPVVTPDYVGGAYGLRF
jgi:hypothetical protein